ncbi:3-deoxy-manno-octulosonate cytidylyltransferase, mitochondrial-like [Daucus carota subsp. sativus]|uniref:3-deoxy-manno-octulosonate cytidylyltransferase, mitochondrial-like n=1 Tax=Daucus carota subsp. sativus TaxID=79200 RepID=UPI003083BBC0
MRSAERMKVAKEHGLLKKIASWCLKSKNMVHAIGQSFLKLLRTWECANLATTLGHVVVAKDDEKLATCCRGFGADVIMTSESCRNGDKS